MTYVYAINKVFCLNIPNLKKKLSLFWPIICPKIIKRTVIEISNRKNDLVLDFIAYNDHFSLFEQNKYFFKV